MILNDAFRIINWRLTVAVDRGHFAVNGATKGCGGECFGMFYSPAVAAAAFCRAQDWPES